MTKLPPAPQLTWAWFFDIDGTLADIALSPDAAHVDAPTQHVIAKLLRTTGGAVAVISGRSLRDVDRMFPELTLPAAGQHGVEHRAATGNVVNHSSGGSGLQSIREALRELVLSYPALVLEDKELSLALHYRAAPQLGSMVHRRMQLLHQEFGADLRLQTGKCVVEVVPIGNNKGAAVREFMNEFPFVGRTPVFVGDDITDEHAFAAVIELQGLAIKVGKGPTIAPFRLPSVAAVRDWLLQSTL